MTIRNLIILVALLLLPSVASAEWMGEMSVGFAHPLDTLRDGTWKQEGVSQPKLSFGDISWRALAGYRWDHVSLLGGYWSLGTAKVKSMFVSDEQYNRETHQCLAPCQRYASTIHDKFQGPVAVGRYQWNSGLFAQAGGMALKHDLRECNFSSWMPAAVAGVGYCRSKLCVETNVVHSFSGMDWAARYPLTDTFVVAMASLQWF